MSPLISNWMLHQASKALYEQAWGSLTLCGEASLRLHWGPRNVAALATDNALDNAQIWSDNSDSGDGPGSGDIR